jgi:hypothetical protein
MIELSGMSKLDLTQMFSECSGKPVFCGETAGIVPYHRIKIQLWNFYKRNSYFEVLSEKPA